MVRLRHPTRYYDIDGKKCPSVTSIIGRTESIFNPSKESSLRWWREKEPDHVKIVDEACRRGSIIHSEVELALAGSQSTQFTIEEWEQYGIPDYITHLLPLIREIKKGESEVEKVVHHPAGYAGTADLICEFEGQVTLVDWKTTRHHKDVGEKTKKRGYYKNAEIQVSAYGAAYNHLTPTSPVTQGLVVVAYSWREPDLIRLDQDDLAMRVTEFQKRLEVFKVLDQDS